LEQILEARSQNNLEKWQIVKRGKDWGEEHAVLREDGAAIRTVGGGEVVDGKGGVHRNLACEKRTRWEKKSFH